MDISNAFNRIFSWFGFWGWWELFGAMLVAIGCGGELWILLNKLTLHVEGIGKSAGPFWKVLAWVDRKSRPTLVRLKIRGRKISEVKEQLLERAFVTLVALGVGLELIAIPAVLRESAEFNGKAATANKLAAEAVRKSSSNELARAKIELQLRQLQIATGPRGLKLSLCELNGQGLSDLLKTNPLGMVEIWHIPNDPEAKNFARELSFALVRAGWKTIGNEKPIPSDTPIREDEEVRRAKEKKLPVFSYVPIDGSTGILIATGDGVDWNKPPPTPAKALIDGLLNNSRRWK